MPDKAVSGNDTYDWLALLKNLTSASCFQYLDLVAKCSLAIFSCFLLSIHSFKASTYSFNSIIEK